MKGINVILADSLIKWESHSCIKKDGKEVWVLSRPLGMTGIIYRLKQAWRVFTGKADVLTWRV